MAVVKAKARGKLRSRGWELGVGIGELRSQPLSLNSWGWGLGRRALRQKKGTGRRAKAIKLPESEGSEGRRGTKPCKTRLDTQ